jgi:hypothetical protein
MGRGAPPMAVNLAPVPPPILSRDREGASSEPQLPHTDFQRSAHGPCRPANGNETRTRPAPDTESRPERSVSRNTALTFDKAVPAATIMISILHDAE